MPRFLVIIIGINAIGLIPAYLPAESSWPASFAVMMIANALYCLGWACEVPYSKPIKKSLLIVQGCVELVHFIFMLPIMPSLLFCSSPLAYVVGIFLGILFSVNVARRWYDRESDELDDAGFFEVWKRPSSPLSLFLSWFTCGGGKSIYADGKWYHFHNDELREYDASVLRLRINKGEYFAIRSRNYSQKDLRKLKSLVGTKWSLFNNCLSVFGRKSF